jgi:hypothetical protein
MTCYHPKLLMPEPERKSSVFVHPLARSRELVTLAREGNEPVEPINLSQDTTKLIHKHFLPIAKEYWPDDPNSPERKSAERIAEILGDDLNCPNNVPLEQKEDMLIVYKFLSQELTLHTSLRFSDWQESLTIKDQSSPVQEREKHYKAYKEDYFVLAVGLGIDSKHTQADWLELGFYEFLSYSELQEFRHFRHAHSPDHRETKLYWLADHFLERVRTERAAKKQPPNLNTNGN